MNKTKKNQFMVASIVLVIVLVSAVFFPEIVSFGSRLINGKTPMIGGLRVSVPSQWWVFKHNDTLIVQRVQSLLRQRGPTSQIVVTPLAFPEGYLFDYEAWKAQLTAVEQRDGYRLTHENDAYLGQQKGSCLNFEALRDTRELWIMCVFPGERISIGYIGNKVYASTLDEVIQNSVTNNSEY